MSIFHGSKSLDAEIFVDLDNKKITMDYSQNKFQGYDSSYSASRNSKFLEYPLKARLSAVLLSMYLYFGCFILVFYLPLFSYLSNHGIIKNEIEHLEYQKFLKWYRSSRYGTFYFEQSGNADASKIIVNLQSNVWMTYKCEGDYKKYISGLSLTRNFVGFKRYGLFEEEKQFGWNLTFNFSQIPKEGKIYVEYC